MSLATGISNALLNPEINNSPTNNQPLQQTKTATMSLFPSMSALSATFGNASPYTQQQQQPPQRKSIAHLYQSWDVAEDAQKKATQLSDAAAKELQKASSAAQDKVGKIELYSPKYYATW